MVERRTIPPVGDTQPLDEEPDVVFHLTSAGAVELGFDPEKMLDR